MVLGPDTSVLVDTASNSHPIVRCESASVLSGIVESVEGDLLVTGVPRGLDVEFDEVVSVVQPTDSEGFEDVAWVYVSDEVAGWAIQGAPVARRTSYWPRRRHRRAGGPLDGRKSR